MKTKLKFAIISLAATLCIALSLTATSQPRPTSSTGSARSTISPLELGRKLSLTLQSHPVEWRSNTYHLVSLGSIQFELDRAIGHLKAEVLGSTTSFDDVTYDISAGVFDAQGTLLGTARSECKVERVWLGNLLTSQVTINLDFGNSLDYANATGYQLGINRCKVLIPDEWQNNK